MERDHFWFRSRRALLKRLRERHLSGPPGARFLDVGCGTGASVVALRGESLAAAGVDGRIEGLAAARQVDRGLPLVQGDAGRLPVRSASLDALQLLDVLEHADDVRLLAEAVRVLRPGGVLLLSVPAMPWLYSYRDSAVGHLRRYTRRGLAGLLARSRFRVREMVFFQCLLFPVVVVSRLLGRMGNATRDLEDGPPRLLRRLFWVVSAAEVRLGAVVRWPWGSSLVAVAEKA